MPEAIQFGTDGWRGIIADDFTFNNVRRLSQATARVLLDNQPQPTVVIGYDTRFLSNIFAELVATTLQHEGVRVILSDQPTPTPVVAHAIRHHQAHGGVVITASHNPPEYNGFKLKANHGGSISKETAEQIERQLIYADGSHEPERNTLEQRNLLPAYYAHVLKLVEIEQIRQAKLSIIVDAMHGAGRGMFSTILGEQAVYGIRQTHNPAFGGVQPEPIARNLEALMHSVRKHKADIGLATDGDADRIGAVDATGRFVDPHHIFAILLNYLVHVKSLRGKVVRSISTSAMIDRIAAQAGLQLHETPVGMGYITDLMLQGDVLLGGEESGGIALHGHVPEGDGVLMGLLLLEVMAVRGLSLAELVEEVQRMYGPAYYRRNDAELAKPINKQQFVAHLSKETPYTLSGETVSSVSTVDGIKFMTQNGAWLLLRPSGTEPVLRIYAEAPTPEQVEALLAAGTTMGTAFTDSH